MHTRNIEALVGKKKEVMCVRLKIVLQCLFMGILF